MWSHLLQYPIIKKSVFAQDQLFIFMKLSSHPLVYSINAEKLDRLMSEFCLSKLPGFSSICQEPKQASFFFRRETLDDGISLNLYYEILGCTASCMENFMQKFSVS